MALNLVLLPLALVAAGPSATGAATDVQRQYERWERRLGARVTELHVVPAAAKMDPACDVIISFAIDHSQRPTDVAIRKSSCQPFHDRAALRLVRSLGRVGRVPSLTGEDHRVLLKLTYGQAPTAAADRELSNELEAERQASSRRNLEIVMMAADRLATASRQGIEH